MKKIKNKQGKRVSRAMKAQNNSHHSILPIKSSRDLPIINVKNAEGDPDTVTQIVVQNQINYTPKVSVIIPVYNVEQYLRECLDSVVNQTLKEIEIICIDDGSTDKSLDILLEYAAKDNRITVLKQENLHAGVARNAGLAVAKGEYVHFLDSDDWVDSDTYEILYMMISEHKADIIKFRSYTYDNVKCEVKNSYFTTMGAVPEKYFNQFIDWKQDYSVLINVSDAPWSGIYDRKFLTDNNILFDNLLCANDVSFFYRCLTTANKIYLSNNRFVYYRVNNSSSLIGIRAYNFDCQLQQFDNINRIIKGEPKNVIQIIRKHLIHSIFYRYTNYIDNHLLDSNTKDKITTQITSFIKNIKKDEVTSEYIGCYNSLFHKIKVSIIIPIYNAEKYLRECLDSVVNQTLKNIEIICVNDGSRDSSLEILKEYSKKDSRIVIINQENSGSAAARNKAISVAKGDYIGFIDSDDYIDANYYQSLLSSALENNADIAATSECKLFNSTGIVSNKNLGLNSKKIIENIADKGSVIITTGVSCNKIYRKQFLLENNIKCLELKNAAEDNYFTDTSIICANKISVVNDVTYYYRITEGSQTQVLKNNSQFSMTEVYKAIDNFILSLKINKNDKKKWLNIINRRKILDFGHFFNTMDEQYKDDFMKHFKNVFPNLDINTIVPIVSLTSYPARINFVASTIKSLLNQKTKPQKIILNLGIDKFPHKEYDLPQELLKLRNDCFEIFWMEKDLGSFSKLIPTLKRYPDKIIVTADDDIIYPVDWLEKLILSYNGNKEMIHCHRAHKIIMKNGNFLPYRKWEFSISDNSASYWNFLTGVGGVLYPPHSLYKDIFKEETFQKLCPKADDIWFWAMAVLNQTKIRIVENPQTELNIAEGSQDIDCLWKTNLAGPSQNDKQLANIIKQYPQILQTLKKEKYRHYISAYLFFPYYLLKLPYLRRKYNVLKGEKPSKGLNYFLYHKITTDTCTKTYICGIRIKKKNINIYKYIDKRINELSKSINEQLSMISTQILALEHNKNKETTINNNPKISALSENIFSIVNEEIPKNKKHCQY